MRKITQLLSAGILMSVIFISCKKDDPVVVQTTLQKIQAKWTFEKEIDHEFYLGLHSRDTTYGVATDYADFRADNKLYTKIGTNMDTVSYALIGDTKLVTIDGIYRDTSDITVLNTNQFQLYSKYVSGANYSESTIYLKK